MADIQIQVNVARYAEDKKLGLCKMIKLNGQTFYAAKEFDRVGKAVVVNAAVAIESLRDMVRNIEREIAEKVASKAAAEQMIADAEGAQEVL
jgi:hypothetical protein